MAGGGRRGGRAAGVPVRHLLNRPTPSIEERERARDDAAQQVRESLEQLAGGLADEAQARMVSAMTPSADEILETGEDVLQASEELLDDMVESAPGGSVVGQVIDFALIPGRYGVRVATTVLKGGPSRAGVAVQGPPSSTWNSSGRGASSASGSRWSGQW